MRQQNGRATIVVQAGAFGLKHCSWYKTILLQSSHFINKQFITAFSFQFTKLHPTSLIATMELQSLQVEMMVSSEV